MSLAPTTPTPTPIPTPTPTPAELPPIKIGALIAFTGPDPNVPATDKGIKLKLDEVGWEVAGRKIELVTEDDAFDATLAVDKAKKLVEMDKVQVIIGPVFQPCAVAVASYLASSRIPELTFVEAPLAAYLGFGGNNVFNLSVRKEG